MLCLEEKRMTKTMLALMISAAAMTAAPAASQDAVAVVRPVAGTRLDISATGSVSRVPDLAIISAGVVTKSPTASGAIADNAARMERVRAALKRAGIADRDIQTSSINLNPEYKYVENQAPQLVGYTASNQVTIRFRDIRNSGKILDALVREGANQINGPNMSVEHPETALDEARANAIAAGRARAELYARSLGMRVVRVVSVSESGSYAPPPAPPMPMYARAEAAAAPSTRIEPGEQKLQVTLSMVFELR
jgi:uncharacterized protein YggE